MQRFFSILLLLITPYFGIAQLCQGSLGDAIVNNTFGAGGNPGAPLPAATTAYQYRSSDCPGDGFYTVITNTTGCFNNTWHVISSDHTGNASGYFMLVNASLQPSAFFIDTVRGLCSNAVFELATYIANVLKPTACGGVGIPPNITFSIEKLDGTVIQTYNSGNIASTNTLEWKQYGFFFTTPAQVSDIVLRLTNNATGGCGNDLALDDITFKPCGPLVTPSIAGLPTNFGVVCQNEAKTFSFNTSVSGGYTNPTYQWQKSINNAAFIDMPGQNLNTLQQSFLQNTATGIIKYRVRVAEAGNLGSPQCSVSSMPITITVYPPPLTTITAAMAICEQASLQLQATGGENYNWQGPNGFTATTSTVQITNAQFAQQGIYNVSIRDANGCQNVESTQITINPTPIITTLFADTNICFNKSITLKATSQNSIRWLPVQFLATSVGNSVVASPTQSIQYLAIAQNSFGCTDTAYTQVNVVPKPLVQAGADKVIVANGKAILEGVIVGNYESFEWLPNEFLTNQNTLTPTATPPTEKQYALQVTAKNGCGIVQDIVNIKIFEGIFIPNVFSPNGDGKNDSWNIPALEAYPLHELILYNRYGQSVFSRRQSFIPWNGKFNGIDQPTGNYTYFINLKNNTPLIKGNVLLVR